MTRLETPDPLQITRLHEARETHLHHLVETMLNQGRSEQEIEAALREAERN